METKQLERINSLMSEINDLKDLADSGDAESIRLLEERQKLIHNEEQTLNRIRELYKSEGMQIEDSNEGLSKSVGLLGQLKEKIMDIASEPIVFGATAAWALKKNLEGAFEVTKDMFTTAGLSVENI